MFDISLYIYIPVKATEVYVCGHINEWCLCCHDGGLAGTTEVPLTFFNSWFLKGLPKCKCGSVVSVS